MSSDSDGNAVSFDITGSTFVHHLVFFSEFVAVLNVDVFDVIELALFFVSSMFLVYYEVYHSGSQLSDIYYMSASTFIAFGLIYSESFVC